MSLTDALLDRSSARPLITFYDDATGERIELSGVTTANWAAKTANLLRDECDVEPGTTVAVLLPAHWQTAAVLLGAWWCGAQVVGDPVGADLVLCDRERLDLALSAAPPLGVVALSLHAFGQGIDGLPAGVVDYATEVRLHGDDFVPWEPVPDSAPALDSAPVSDVVAAARDRAAALGFTASDRVLSTLDWSSPGGLTDGLLAVLAAGASLVQCRHPDPAALERRAGAERTTARLGSG
ncbi:TIGR03089 family protein [Pseudonocardia hydrocarbonoxydans]|uniref:TIGR03089 family protein n=1 Tax=Pseudonocardia hydrocarbonoxydans TaxID=76726 RepID=A0A4Y3WX25_9PSEU|nr:TIGR03089 family protein [Pseudonocardia hydrocarbonoxydans]GEC21956.1 TIGR03089 family protein [Pseudonocardia hydrocarbonoxydans]